MLTPSITANSAQLGDDPSSGVRLQGFLPLLPERLQLFNMRCSSVHSRQLNVDAVGQASVYYRCDSAIKHKHVSETILSENQRENASKGKGDLKRKMKWKNESGVCHLQFCQEIVKIAGRGAGSFTIRGPKRILSKSRVRSFIGKIARPCLTGATI